jgi:cation diffusion facilitator family transporter
MTEKDKGAIVLVERWGWASIAVNVGLSTLNLGVLWLSGSLAVAAEMVHNFVDLAASVAVLVGLKLSRRKSDNFPYGMYKIENMVAAGIAMLIFFAAYEIVREALLGRSEQPRVTPWVIAGVGVSLLVPVVFSVFQMRAGRKANSPSLIADAKEYRVHVLTSGVVLVALLGHHFGLHLERIASLLVVLAVVKTGWDLLADAMRVLLDASLDHETLDKARTIIEREPSLMRIRSLVGRNAGRYRFLEAVIEVRIHELERADKIGGRLEQELRRSIPFLERILVDVKSACRDNDLLALPLQAPAGPASKQFGTAPHFLFLERRREDGTLLGRSIVGNPFASDSKGRGIKVANWLLQKRIDALVTVDDIREKGPGYALKEAGVQIQFVTADSVEAAINAAVGEVIGDIISAVGGG